MRWGSFGGLDGRYEPLCTLKVTTFVQNHANRGGMASEAMFARHLPLVQPDDDCTSCSRCILEVVTGMLGVIWGLDGPYKPLCTLRVTTFAQNHANRG